MKIFKIALPGNDVKDSRLGEEALNSLYPSPKVNTLAQPPHVGIITVNWASSGLAYAQGTVKIIHSFIHGYDYIPTTFGTYSYDNGLRVLNGVMPFQLGATGFYLIDADTTRVYLKYLSLDLSGTAAVPTHILKVRFYVMAEQGI